MEEHGGHVELVEVPHADQAIAIEAFVSYAGSANPHLTLRELKKRWGLTDVSKGSNALQAQAAKLKCAASSKKPIVAAARYRARLPIFRPDNRTRAAGSALFPIPPPLYSTLSPPYSHRLQP